MKSLKVTVKNADIVISYKLLQIVAGDELFMLDCFLHSLGLDLPTFTINYFELIHAKRRLSDDDISKIHILTGQLGNKISTSLGTDWAATKKVV